MPNALSRTPPYPPRHDIGTARMSERLRAGRHTWCGRDPDGTVPAMPEPALTV
jgi:hypothetical protein